VLIHELTPLLVHSNHLLDILKSKLCIKNELPIKRTSYWELSIKKRPQSGGLSSSDIFRKNGEVKMRTSALFGEKTSDFLKFMLFSH